MLLGYWFFMFWALGVALASVATILEYRQKIKRIKPYIPNPVSEKAKILNASRDRERQNLKKDLKEFLMFGIFIPIYNFLIGSVIIYSLIKNKKNGKLFK